MGVEFNPPNPNGHTRREFLKFLTGSALTLAANNLSQGLYPKFPSPIPDTHPVRFTPEQLGVNINLRAISWYGLGDTAIDELLALPFQNVRIPIPFDYFYNQRGDLDKLIGKAQDSGKSIHLQLGVKTIGSPEIHLPPDVLNDFPYLNDPGPLDADAGFRKIVLNYIGDVSKHYLPLKEVASIHVENESFSQNLAVANKRYVSTQFNAQEVEVVRNADPYHRPILQNLPFDTPSAMADVIKSSDIVGLNIYNQYKNPDLPLWTAFYVAAIAVRLAGKALAVTEYQTAAWLKSKDQPEFPFNADKFVSGLRIIKAVNPAMVFFWDVEQLLYRKYYYEEEPDQWEVLRELPKAA